MEVRKGLKRGKKEKEEQIIVFFWQSGTNMYTYTYLRDFNAFGFGGCVINLLYKWWYTEGLIVSDWLLPI